MSGKAKIKRKDKIKPKPHEIELFNKYIDTKRLAYDVIKYTAIRFHVPERCIAVWDGKCNDYELDDFFFLFCMRIVLQQITERGRCHVYFSGAYERNKLAHPRYISELLYRSVRTITDGFTIPPLKIVEVSLAITCELFLYLYSMDLELNPKKLAFNWYECYLNLNKKDFEEAGGFREIYLSTSKRKCGIMDSLLNKFIEVYCLPYDASANNPSLDLIFNILMDDSLPPKEKERVLNELSGMEDLADRLTGVKMIEPPAEEGATGGSLPEREKDKEEKVIEPPAEEGATGGSLPEREEEKIIEPPAEEGATGGSLADKDSELEESSQELPAASPEDLPWYHSALTTEERARKIWSKIRQFSLDSSRPKKASDPRPRVSLAPSAAQSHEHQGVRPKDRP